MPMIYHIPAESYNAACRIAEAIDAGKVICPAHYKSPAMAEAQARKLAALHTNRAFCVWQIEVRGTISTDGTRSRRAIERDAA
jgi:hypothetical protein